MFKKLLLFSCLALSMVTARATYVPVTITSFNADVVANGTGAPTTSNSAVDYDGAGYFLFDSTFNPGTAPTSWMPSNRLITSITNPAIKFQLAPYTGNNSLKVTGTNTDSLVFGTPTAAGEVYLLWSTGSGPSNASLSVNFTDGTNQPVAASQVDNWYDGANTAMYMLARWNSGVGFQYYSNNPRLYQYQIPILAANQSKLIRSITVNKTTANGVAAINVMGVTINTVCSGAPTAGAVASSTGTSVCSGISFTLSLPNATTGTGLTYQWQSSPTGSAPWTNIASATSATYTASQTAATSYRAVITCGGTSSDTSAPIAITMKPANQCYCTPPANTSSNTPCSSVDNMDDFYTTGLTSNITSTPGCVNVIYTDRTSLVASAYQNATVNFTIKTGASSSAETYKIWGDWNQNGILDDAGELVYTGTSLAGNATINGTFNVPLGATPGNTRLRLRLAYANTTFTPCNATSYGQTFDYTFNVVALPPCVTPAQPTALTINTGATTASISYTASSPAADRYLIVRTPGIPLNANPANGTTYAVGNTIGNGVVIANLTGTSFSDAGLTPATSYTYTIFAFNNNCIGGPLYDTVSTPTSTVLTKSFTVYTWNGSVSTDWTVAGNWTPVRTVPDPTDVLQFTDGLADTAKNIPTQTIKKLLIANNTSAFLQASASTAATLTISDTVAATADLDINAGSALYSNGNGAALTIAFNGANNTANIAGRLESISNAVNNVFNMANTTATVGVNGVLASGGSNGSQAITNSTATSLQINGLYDYKYTSSNPGLPLASWNTGSTLLISGVTTATGGPNGNQNQTFYNFTYNSPNQTSTTNWSGTGATTVLNNFSVLSTGTTGTWQFATTQTYTANIKNFIQSGGILDLAGGSTTNTQVFNITGSFTKSGGTLKATNTTGQPTLNYAGTTAQAVSFDASPSGRIWYRISNNAGINLTGTGGLTTFNVNDNGGIRISTTAAAPITTALTIAYGTTGSTLVYDTTGSYSMTPAVFPATAGPQNLTINLGSSNNVINMPFSRTIPGTLTMTSGDINLSSNTLTLGTSAAAAGTLSYSSGNIRITTGSMTRWYGTTGLPTAAGTGVGFYPLSYGSANRNVAISFDAATALSTGGTITVGHTNLSGLATVSVPDPSPTYTIDRRTNAYWTVNATGLVLSGTNKIKMQLTGSGLIAPTNPANLRVMQAAAVAGTHVAGSGTTALRKDLVVADLTAMNYYIGAAAADIGSGVYVAINSGPWSTGSTWDIGTAPTLANDAYINAGVVVTADAATNAAKSLNILAGGTLNAGTGTVTIDSALQNNGTVNVSGGTLVVNGNSGTSGITNNAGANFNVNSGTARLGPVNGGNKPFTNNGILSIGGGTLNINGNLVLNSSATFNQSGGNINVDGNAGNVLANSVAASTPIVNILTSNVNLTGGTFTLVDPHLGSNTNSFVYNNGTSINASGTHVFMAGNGTSLDTGNNASYGMSVNTNVGSGKLAFMDVVVNSGTAANSWLVFGASNTGVLGNFTVNAGGEFRQNGTGNTLYLAGNLVNNGTYSGLGVTYFGRYAGGSSSSGTAPQTVSGTGTFRNVLSGTPTANIYKIQVNNNNNVTFNTGNFSFSNNLTFVAATGGPSHIIMPGTSRLIENSGATNTTGASTGWIIGRYQKGAGTGGMNNVYPIGDATAYTPVTVAGTVLTAGALWAGTTSGDHPNLSSSTINPRATVNRYYTIDTLNGLTFTAGTMSATLSWVAADLDPSVVPANFIIGNYKGTTWTYPTVSTPTTTSIKATGLTGDVVGQYAVGEPCGTAVSIANQPVSKTGCAGSPISLSVTASPISGATYTWKKGTTVIPGATDSIYTIPALSAADAGTYTVVVGSGCPSIPTVTSNAVTVTVNAPAAITTQPVASQSICNGSPATFTVATTGTGLTYQWRKNGAPLSGNGASTNTYTIPAVSPADSGNYTVDVIGAAPCGTITSAISTLSIKPLPLTITAGGTTNFCPGGSVVLTAPATTPTNTLSYVWKVNGNPITPAQTGQTYTATTTGSYTATITSSANGCSNTSNAIVVNVNGAPQSTITPSGTATVCQGDSITLHGLSTAGLTYEWYLNGNTSTVLSTDSTYRTGVAGSYTLKVSIGSGCSTVSTSTVVNTIALPSITTTPTGAQAICQGDSLGITALYNNATLQWKQNGANITGATGNTYYAKTAANYTVTITSTLTGCKNTSAPVTLTINALPTVTVSSANAATFCAGGSDTLKAAPTTGLTYVWNRGGTPIAPAATGANYVATTSGSYTVTATNANGCKATSAAVAVTVNPLPSVVVTPSNGITICQGQTTSLCVPSATGVTYQWKDGTNVLTGATSNCYAATTAGNYSVTATNSTTGCSATSTVSSVVVNPIPTATITPPARTTICQGDTMCLTANTGANLTYQWRLGTNAIVGATGPTYCVTASGVYSVVVTNGSNCSVTSAPVTMTVNPRPTATISYTTPVTFCEGGAVVLTGVSNTGTTYQWQNNGGAISGATNNNYIASTDGSYSVIITNTFGCATVSPPILVVVNPLPQPVITRNGTSTLLSTGSYATYQWYLNSQPIPGATGQSINATQNGGYAVRVQDANGCVNYSTVMFINNVGIGGNPSIQPAAVKVFPNPVRSVINIEAPAQVNVVLRDLTGRMIKQVDNVKQLDMTGLTDGYYMLMISDKNGVMIKAEKVMKIAE